MPVEASMKKTVGQTSKRKIRTGIIYSDKMDKTITVLIKGRKRHPFYGKTITFTNKLKAHDEKNEAREGDYVEIMETRPLSKSKRWRLTKIIERKK